MDSLIFGTTDLQSTFYVLGIIFMAVMLLLVLGILISVLIIKAKVNAFHRAVNGKVDMVKHVAGYAGRFARVLFR
jgi:hypothetical protein